MNKKIVLLLFVLLVFVSGCGKKETPSKKEDKKEEVKEEKMVEIIDLESKSRPYAVGINNYPEATKVQTGLNEAYIIYEMPIEGGMTRSLAL